MVSIGKTLSLNKRYIAAVNSCDRAPFISLLEELLKIDGAFIKKRYIWNWIRGREFYKNLAWYVTTQAKSVLDGYCENPEYTMAKIELVIKIVMGTERRDKTRKMFVDNITKPVPLITADTIRYMSAERVNHILTSEKRVLNDSVMEPFIHEIIRLKTAKAQSDITLNETIDMMMDD